jgi:TonB family protein
MWLAISLLMFPQGSEGASTPAPLSSPSSWIAAADYPRRLQSFQGYTVAALTVDENGRVTGCKIKESSGSAELDGTVCRRVYERAQFSPARDTAGNPVEGSFLLPVLWGKPPIKIEPRAKRLVSVLQSGKVTSCTDGETEIKCSISPTLLRQHFGRDLHSVDRLVIESFVTEGAGAIPREKTDGIRVTLSESEVRIDSRGRVQSCRSRLPSPADDQSLEDCVGYPTDRVFTGLKEYVKATDWTIYPADSD